MYLCIITVPLRTFYRISSVFLQSTFRLGFDFPLVKARQYKLIVSIFVYSYATRKFCEGPK